MPCTMLREEMVAVLYGEADAETVRRVGEHQAACADCRDEMAALRGLRRQLTAWRAPEPARGVRRPRPRPWAALAAAAAIVFALGAGWGLAGAELRYEKGRVSFRLGGGDQEIRTVLDRERARLQEEIAALRAAVAARPSGGDAAFLERVAAMIRESEARQAVLMSASLQEIGERNEAQRRYDLARVSAGLSYLDGRTGEQVARTNELMGYVLQVSQQR
ncbi:MAG: hypothetical protein HY317_04215 [Acidobacteria bacterium]|nr:hypothetical protein [Acidobacteriota bacterium]